MTENKRRYENRAVTSLPIEKMVLDEVRKSGYALNDIFMKGWSVLIPSGMTGRSLRKRQLRRDRIVLVNEKEVIEEKIMIIDQEIKTIDEDIGTVEVEIKKEEDKRMIKLKKLWPEFRKKVKGNPTWIEGDPEIHVWWEVRGVTISYGELVTVWDEMEALNG